MNQIFQPEKIIEVFHFSITNTFIATLLADFVILFIAFRVSRNPGILPGKLQNAIEYVIEYFYDFTQLVAGERVKSIFPWFMSFFVFIFFSNIMGLIPGFGSIGFFEEGGKKLVPLFRAATSDFNTTFALAVISLISTHVLSIRYTGIKDYLKRFFSINPLFLFVGLLEIISEITKLFSLSFRLFGNIFAGEVVLSTISSLFAFIAPIPFLMLEGLVAFVQALVFAMLTMVFMSILTTPHAEH